MLAYYMITLKEGWEIEIKIIKMKMLYYVQWSCIYDPSDFL